MILNSRSPVVLDEAEPPQLLVVIDTEEEFDWNKPVSRESTSVSSMNYIDRVQDIFDDYGIRPCYVIDYPIASQEQGYQGLASFHKENRCEIGAHLHPWVTPPDSEELRPENTSPGNLESSLEFEKLKNLTEVITQNLGVKPVSYKAGRYGFGNNTESILRQLGYQLSLIHI